MSCKWCRWQLSLLYSSILFKTIDMDKFLNPQIGINMRIQHPHIYKNFPTFKKNWTSIEQKITEIQIGNNLLIILLNWTPIQLISCSLNHTSCTRFNT